MIETIISSSLNNKLCSCSSVVLGIFNTTVHKTIIIIFFVCCSVVRASKKKFRHISSSRPVVVEIIAPTTIRRRTFHQQTVGKSYHVSSLKKLQVLLTVLAYRSPCGGPVDYEGCGSRPCRLGSVVLEWQA